MSYGDVVLLLCGGVWGGTGRGDVRVVGGGSHPSCTNIENPVASCLKLHPSTSIRSKPISWQALNVR